MEDASLAAPEQSRSGGAAGLEEEEPAVSSKELGEWLRQHPTYTMDMAAFTPVGSAGLGPPLRTNRSNRFKSIPTALFPSIVRRTISSLVAQTWFRIAARNKVRYRGYRTPPPRCAIALR